MGKLKGRNNRQKRSARKPIIIMKGIGELIREKQNHSQDSVNCNNQVSMLDKGNTRGRPWNAGENPAPDTSIKTKESDKRV